MGTPVPDLGTGVFFCPKVVQLTAFLSAFRWLDRGFPGR